MREWKNPDSTVRCYRYRIWLKTHHDGFRLPDCIYVAATKRREFWNLLVAESEQRYAQWSATHPPMPALGNQDIQTISKKSGLPIMKSPKPDKGYWDSFFTWGRERAAASGLNWEDAPDILDRFMGVFKRMSKSGGGAPKAQQSLHRFAFLHRYTGGGLPVANLANDRQRRARILFPPSEAYFSNSRECRRARLVPAWFEIDGQTLSLAVLLHRELPVHAKVKRISLTGHQQSPLMPWEYALIFTVEMSNDSSSPSRPHLGVGIDVRWRKLDEDRLLVATMYDGTRHQELSLPLHFSTSDLGEVSLRRIERAEALQSACLNKCKTELRPLLSVLPSGFAQMGRKALFQLMQQSEKQGHKEAASLIERCLRDHSRYRRIALLVENRLHGRRQHLYQNFAAGLARRYGSWNVENIAIKDLKERETSFRATAKYRNYASPGCFCKSSSTRRRNTESDFMKFLRNIPPTVVLVAAELLKLGNSAREDAQLVTGPIRIGMQRKTFSQTPRVFGRKRKLRRWELDFAIHLECVYQLSEAVVDQCPADWMLEQGNFGTFWGGRPEHAVLFSVRTRVSFNPPVLPAHPSARTPVPRARRRPSPFS